MTQTRVNIRSRVNAATIRRERRDGRDVIVVPSATLPDDVVMNRVKYPAGEIERSYLTLNGTPAPLGHPSLNGAFLSASDPQGMTRGFIGAWNENARRENGRVFVDKVIDVDYAKQLEGGRAVLEAIDKGEPIHTSTGLYAVFMPSEDAGFDSIATDIVFDHDAILLGEVGAATPAQGVGMMVNKARGADGAEIDAINSALDDAERDLDWAVDSVVRAAERVQRVPLLDKLKSVILDAIRGDGKKTPDPETATEEPEQMPVTDDEIKAMAAKSDAIANALEKLTERVEALAGIGAKVDEVSAAVNAQAEAAKAAADGELATLRAAIVKSNLMTEAAAGELTLNAARALADHATPKPGYGLNAAFGGDKSAAYELPE